MGKKLTYQIDYEYHISGDIAQEFANYWLVSGDTDFFRSSLFPIYESIATFYSQVVAQDNGQYILTNMTDPDEYADHVDNGGFTMPLIATTLNNTNMLRQRFGVDPSTDFTNIASNIRIERDADAGIILEYRGMRGSVVVKQADVVLNTFPLNYQTDYTTVDGLKDLEYYASKQTLNGPGMTYAIFSIVAAAVDVAGCSSFTYQQYSEHPYARAPWFQFSEQLNDNFEANGGKIILSFSIRDLSSSKPDLGTHPAFPFLTGHGGANQITVFGYLGLRLTYDSALHINPSLPPQIPRLKYRTFYWQGFPISATSNQTHTTLTRLPTPLATCNSSFIGTSIPILVGNAGSYTQYMLPPAGFTVVPNRNVSSYTSITGNIAQCLPASSPDAIVPGQLPIAAVDGAPSTKWQPASNTAATMTIALGDQHSPVTSLHFDWAQAPPLAFTVWFHNSSTFDDTTAILVTQQSRVSISNPYDASKADDIVPYVGNTTNVTLTPNVWSGSFARLSISGNQNGLGDVLGATVAEWAIVMDKGSQNTTSWTNTTSWMAKPNGPTAIRGGAKISTSDQSLASSASATVTSVPATIVSAAPSPSPNAAVIIYREDSCDDASCSSIAHIYAIMPGNLVNVCSNPKSIGSINYPSAVDLDLTKDFDIKSSAFSTGGHTNCVFYGQNLPVPIVGENVGDLECADTPLLSIQCVVPAAQPTSCTSSHDLYADDWTPIAYCEWVAVIG